ncbi:MAG: hypothetical protein HF312_15450 [Ignavibacteria bacterium]|jgi:hypothetical protein|nr:hypothetical protein [Ignavibacteria bacterium]
MAITFDQPANIDRIYYYKKNTNTYAKRASTTNFDLFPEDAAVGDCMVFATNQFPWHNLTLNITTPLVAASISVVWEYAINSYSWSAIPDVNDGTNAFRNSGTVSFSVPNAMSIAYVKSYPDQGVAIRCRITAVSGLTEGGANSGLTATVLDWALHLDGAVYTPADLQTTSDTNGWGVVSSINNAYQIDSNVFIGKSAAATWQLSNCFVTIGTATNLRSLQMVGASKLQLGNLVNGMSANGATLRYYPYSNTQPYNTWSAASTFNMYDSFFWKPQGSFNEVSISSVCDIRNSILSGDAYYFPSNSTGQILDTTLECNGRSTYFYSKLMAISNLLIANAGGVYLGTPDARITNTDFGSDKKASAVNYNLTVYAQDCDFVDYDTQVNNGSLTNTIHAQYTVILSVADTDGNAIDGAHATLVNSTGSIIYDGDAFPANGLLVTTYTARGVDGVQVRSHLDPFTLTITKRGYEPYTRIFNINNNTRRVYAVLSLVKQQPGVLDVVNSVTGANPASSNNQVGIQSKNTTVEVKNG